MTPNKQIYSHNKIKDILEGERKTVCHSMTYTKNIQAKQQET